MLKELTKDNIKHINLFIFDVWGVVHIDGIIKKEIIDLIRYLILTRKKIVFLSNAPRRSSIVLENLKKLDKLFIEEEFDIFSSGEFFFQELSKTKEQKQYYIFGPSKDENILLELPQYIKTNILEEVDFIIITGDPTDGYDLNLDNSLDILQRISKLNKKIYCINPDIIVPSKNKRICAGFVAEKLEKMGAKIIYTGKPYKKIYENIFQKYNYKKDEILMIGDSFNTDILGAYNAGIKSCIVYDENTGKYKDLKLNLIELINFKSKEFSIDFSETIEFYLH